MIVSDNTIQAEDLCDFFYTLGKKGLNVLQKMEKNLKNSSRFLDNTANVATPAASRNPKNVISTIPQVINFYQTDSVLHSGKFV